MQFGRALQCCDFTRIVHADRRYGPVLLTKIDIADGFYCVWLQIEEDIPKLGAALPSAPGCPPLVAFPLTLPMLEWVESPPYFTVVLTGTAFDLANAAITTRQPLSRLRRAHRLEAVASTPPDDASPCTLPQQVVPPSTLQGHGRAPAVAAVDVYVDDFLLFAQTTQTQQRKVMRAGRTAIDDVFRQH